MQEEIISKSVEVGFRISNLTLDLILKGLDAIAKDLGKKPDEKPIEAAKDGKISKEPKTPKVPELKQGKQTLKQLHKHNDGLSSIELTDPNLRKLHKSMKQADIDFSVMKDGKGKYTLFFKGKNADEMTNAFKRYTSQVVNIADKKSIKLDLKISKSVSQELNRVDKEKKKRQRTKIKVKGRGSRDR